MKHLDFIRGLPCVVCGNNIQTEAAHVRFADPRAAKVSAGLGRKPDDEWTVPLCGEHHREQHAGGEAIFWKRHGIDPIFVAMALKRISGDQAAGERIVQCASEPVA